MYRNFLKAFIALVASTLFTPFAQAAPIIWQLQATFQDGSTASGSFSYNADTNTYGSTNIVTTAGLLPSSTYTIPSVSGPTTFIASQTAGWPSGSHILQLVFSAPLTNAGGTISTTAGSFESTCPGGGFSLCNSNPFRLVSSGAVSSIPEPATAALTVAALVALAITRPRYAA